MAKLLVNLRQVPDDEAMEIRELLDQHQINYYETDAGFWRVGVAAIWLVDEQQLLNAQELIKEYQQKRTRAERERYRVLQESGQAPTLGKRIIHSPFRFLGMVIAVLFVLAITLFPFAAFLTYRG